MEMLGLADPFGSSEIPIYCLNVTYPLIPEEVKDFCAGKKAVLIVEEGQPEFIEHELNTLVRRAELNTRIVGKDTRSEEHTSELQSLMRISYAVFCLQKQNTNTTTETCTTPRIKIV